MRNFSRISTGLIVISLIVSGFAVGAEKAADPKKAGAKKSTKVLKTSAEKFSYALGMEIGTWLKRLPTKVDMTLFTRGLTDTVKGSKTLLSEKEAMAAKEEFIADMQKKMSEKSKVVSEQNKKKGADFLAKNGKAKGVETTKSGLQYMVLKQGNGATPKATDKVKVHYSGKLLDGTEFDSSYKRGEPITFAANRVIPGWTEGLQLMKVGGKYRLFIPSDLAYGDRGAGQSVPPGATLIFEVELLGIEK